MCGMRSAEERMLCVSCGSRRRNKSAHAIVDIVFLTLTPRLQELNNCPNGNVLERRVGAAQEPKQVGVQAALGLLPDIVECAVVIQRRTLLCNEC